MHGGDLVAEVLSAHKVKYIFTLCGGHIAPILIGCKKKEIQVVDVRHEANAVFAADGVSRLSGITGVAAVTAGPGLTNTITAVKNAQLAQSPLVLLGGATATMLKGRGSLQDIDQMALMKPHVKWMKSVKTVKEIPKVLQAAFAHAVSGVPGPVFVEIPIDLLYEKELVQSWYGAQSDKAPRSLGEKIVKWYLNRHVQKLFAGVADPPEIQVYSTSTPAPSEWEIDRVLQRLKQAKRPLMLIGSQAMVHSQEVEKLPPLLEKLSVPLYLSGMARGLMGKSHGLQMRHKRRMALKDADLVFLMGVPSDFRLNYGRHIGRKTAVVLVNLEKKELRQNRDLMTAKPRFEILGDSLSFLVTLAKGWKGGPDWTEWKENLQVKQKEREDEIDRAIDSSVEEYMNPLKVLAELEKALDPNSVVVADGGDFVASGSYILRPPGPLSWLDPGRFGTLGVGAGFAMAGKLVHPKKEVWILYGDGSFGYSLAEFDTFCRHKLPVIAVVGNDGSWSQIAREQIEIFHDDVATTLERRAYHKAVEGLGGKGILVERENDLSSAYQEAKQLAKDGHPVLINCLLGASDFRKGSISM